MYFVAGFCLLCGKLELLSTVYEENSIMTQFTLPETRKQQAVLFGIHIGSYNTKTLQCLDDSSEDPKRVGFVR